MDFPEKWNFSKLSSFRNMNAKLSRRLEEIVNALPIGDGMRILEIGCGSGAAAREIIRRIESGHVLAIDRSSKAIEKAIECSEKEIASGRLSFRQAKIEEFNLLENERRYDIAFAVRVGALDGRHPEIEQKTLSRIVKSLTDKGRLFTDGGNPLKEISLANYLRLALASDREA